MALQETAAGATPAGATARTAAPEWKIDYLSPAGEASLVPPDSVQWRVYRNPIAIGIGGVAAVLLEFADPRIRSGVWDHSVFKVDPIGRSRRTGVAAMVGVYGPASVARKVIGGVNRMHGKVRGETPGGQAYFALDPVLLDWVFATALFGFSEAYHQFVRPLSPDERTEFYRDGAIVGTLYGVRNCVGSPADFDAMLGTLLPNFEPHPINTEFLNIICSGEASPSVPRFLHRALARAAVSILPPVVRARLALGSEWDLTVLDRLALKTAGRLADLYRDRTSPAWQGAIRQGLPGDFSWRPPAEQRELFAARQAAPR